MTPDDYLRWGRLIQHLTHDGPVKERAIPWASPVPCYGNPATALLATVALHASHGEFISRANTEIRGQQRRFHTLRSLRIRSWADAEAAHIERMDHLCRAYFKRNPYRQWHGRFEPALQFTGQSYQSGTACHLPLIPYAIRPTGGRVMPEQEIRRMMETTGADLGRLVRDAPIRLLILNGIGMVSRFEWLAGVELTESEQPLWKLSGSQVRNDDGFAYQGAATRIAGVDLGREVVVVGFNHSLTSRYMDAGVRRQIAEWICETAVGVLTARNQ